MNDSERIARLERIVARLADKTLCACASKKAVYGGATYICSYCRGLDEASQLGNR